MKTTTKQETLNAKKELLSNKKKLAKIIGDWADRNKRIFWKYEVSCFYKTYVVRITNLPKPSTEDIMLSSNNRLLTGQQILVHQQKTQLCDAITKACVKAQALHDSSVNVQIDYKDGVVITEIL
jgi:hypothetical protein